MSTFIQAGTGAVTRTVESRLRETVSVKDFGATGNGTTDDTTAFVNALNYLASRTGVVGAGTLYVPQGVYKLSQALALPSTVNIVGDGPVNSKLQFTGATSHGITMIRPINSSTQTFNRIEGLRIDGTGSTSTGFGVYDQGGTEWVLRDCFIAYWKYGVVMDQSEIITIENCDIAACNKAGIWLVNGPDLHPSAGGGFTNRITIRECQFNGCGQYSIIDDGGLDHMIRDNNFNYATTAHLRAAGVSNLLVQGGEWEGAPRNVVITSVTEQAQRGVGQCGSVCLMNNDFTQPGGVAAVQVTSACAGLSVIANGFANMGNAGALIQGLHNVTYLFTAGNIFYEHTNQGGKFLDGKAVIHNVVENTFEMSAVADIGSLAAGAYAYTNITGGGLAVGDFVESVSAAPDLGDQFEVTARVSAASTVRVRVRNIGTVTADPVAATFRVRVRRRDV
ncbi:MAG TPA: glycosyl hydrolase family 28-related protein [Longimicrobiaceae bacterium]